MRLLNARLTDSQNTLMTYPCIILSYAPLVRYCRLPVTRSKNRRKYFGASLPMLTVDVWLNLNLSSFLIMHLNGMYYEKGRRTWLHRSVDKRDVTIIHYALIGHMSKSSLRKLYVSKQGKMAHISISHIVSLKERYSSNEIVDIDCIDVFKMTKNWVLLDVT